MVTGINIYVLYVINPILFCGGTLYDSSSTGRCGFEDPLALTLQLLIDDDQKEFENYWAPLKRSTLT